MVPALSSFQAPGNCDDHSPLKISRAFWSLGGIRTYSSSTLFNDFPCSCAFFSCFLNAFLTGFGIQLNLTTHLPKDFAPTEQSHSRGLCRSPQYQLVFRRPPTTKALRLGVEKRARRALYPGPNSDCRPDRSTELHPTVFS